MRITNKIMQRNNLSNINTNKVNEDRLSTQMSTEKKINRPSDDPVVAIRALRLRSSVTEVTQYYSKNIPDAESWINVTQDALNNLTQVLTNLISQCNKGSNNYLESEDREIILEQMKALADEIYSTGDVDYAGRYVFTGYRTDTTLRFTEEVNQLFHITEQLGIDSLDDVTKVYTDKLLDINGSNYMDVDVTEQDIDAVTCHRIRLAYNDCVGDDSAAPSISFKQMKMQPKMDETTGQPVVGEDGNPIYEPVIGPDGKPEYETITWSLDNGDIQTVHSYEDPYSIAANDPDAIVFVPETGELLLGENKYNQLMAIKDDESTVANEGEIRVSYQKSHWEKGDLRPQHYFACTSDPGTDKEINYNENYLTEDVPERQVIEYDVGFNQTIRVNSTADECFKHGIGREVDDLISAMQNVKDLENIKTQLGKFLKEAEGDEEKTAHIQDQLDAVDKALTLAKDKEQKLFESGISAFQGYLDDANLCITNCGNRGSKLALIENRMQTQKTTFETLKSNNEDIDIADVTIQLKSAELVYEAALLAAGKVMQATLLNYI